MTREDVAILCPGPADGQYHPYELDDILGKTVVKDVVAEEVIFKDHTTAGVDALRDALEAGFDQGFNR